MQTSPPVQPLQHPCRRPVAGLKAQDSHSFPPQGRAPGLRNVATHCRIHPAQKFKTVEDCTL